MAKKAAAAKASAAEEEAPKPRSPSKKAVAAAPAEVVAPTKVAAAVKKATPLLTLTDIGDHLASTFDMPKSHAKIYLAEAVALIGKNLRKGNKVRISGLGVFQVKKRGARKGRNPSSGELIKIKATKRVAFAVARDLKAKL